ncbi:MAG: DUF6285 domain-containing protein [Nevskia sp.]|nr:DUF6285 domain-containing protein [Nevskia sp.]
MISFPTRDELLEAVSAYLREQLLPRLSGSERYQAQVAVKALEVVARDLALGTRSDAEARERLLALLGGSPSQSLEQLDAELCARLRDGRIRPDQPALLAHLRATTRARLAIDNPGFAFACPSPDRAADGTQSDGA